MLSNSLFNGSGPVLLPSLLTKDVHCRAPLRLGLAGGGTDVSPYSDDYGGAILNATIDRYAFAFIEPSADWKIRFVAVDLGIEEVFPLEVDAVVNARLMLHAAVYRRMIREFADGTPLAVTVRTSVDAPPGSGLGSSSALVVALVEAFRAVLDVPLGPYDVAHLAFEIERIDLALSGGKQDQYAAAFGGVNFIEFLREGQVIVNPLRIPRATLNELETSLITSFSGVSRRSEEIIDQQRAGMRQKLTKTIDSLHQLKSDAVAMRQALLRGNIMGMAEILNRSWDAKKKLAAGISSEHIEGIGQIAFKEGALASKVSGAGGGGYIIFVVPPERRVNVIRALNEFGAPSSGVQFTMVGAESWVLPTRTS